MSALAKPKLMTEAEYLDHEDRTEYRSEYYNGELFAISGVTDAHTKIEGNLYYQLRQLLGNGRCYPRTGSTIVKIPNENMYTYPDVSVVCQPEEFADAKRRALLNPRVIIEVLSESTMDYDGSTKRLKYFKIPSLMEYILVSQFEPLIERYSRLNGKWDYALASGIGETLHIESLDLHIPFTVIYERVTFPDVKLFREDTEEPFTAD